VNVFGIGLPEMAVIMVLALLIFGPKKLPEIGRTFGKAIRSFQDASKEFESEFKKETDRLEKVVSEPMKATLEPPAQPALTASNTEAAQPATPEVAATTVEDAAG
jgi:sec-independent protein translocase protein TatA